MSVERLRMSHDAEARPAARRLADRVRDLEAEARAAAHEHVTGLSQALADVVALSAEVGEGGAAYPVGVRELARRLADQLRGQHDILVALQARHAPASPPQLRVAVR